MSNKKRFRFVQDPFHLGLKCVSLPGGLNESPGVTTLQNAQRKNCNPICPLALESDQGHVVTTVTQIVSVIAVASPNRAQQHRGWKCIVKVDGHRRREVVVEQVSRYLYSQSLRKAYWTVFGSKNPFQVLRSSSTS